MITPEKAVKRIDQIVVRLRRVLANARNKSIDGLDEIVLGECVSLVAASRNLGQLLFDDSQTAYAMLINNIDLHWDAGTLPARHNKTELSSLMHTLENMRVDIEEGLLGSVRSQVQAAIFDDFIDSADAFLEADRKNEAGAIAGVTFEDTIRKLCAKNLIVEKGREIDQLISELVRAKVLNATEAKRARVGAHVRTKATHAQWDEFATGDVKEVIEFLRNCLLLRLAS